MVAPQQKSSRSTKRLQRKRPTAKDTEALVTISGKGRAKPKLAGPTALYRLDSASPDTLASVKLPPGVEIALLPKTKAAEQQLKKIAKTGRFKLTGYVVRDRARKLPQGPAAEGAIAREAYAPSGRALALLRGHEIHERDLKAAGGTFDLGEVMGFLQISRQAVDKRVKEGSLLAVPGPNGQRRYPTAQFGPGGLAKGLREVLRALPSESPWFRLNFLANPDFRLDGARPIDLLHRGCVDQVVEAAKRVGEQGA